jgi:CRISPR/Cas system-associated exonuclease Cas4 (RecB family)
MLESYEFCPRQFYHQFVEGVQKDANQKMLIGTRFHEFAERFFDYAEVIPQEHWDELIPLEHLNDEEITMYEWFVSYQRSRLTLLTKEDRVNEFIPLYRELYMICDHVQIKSTLDGAEWVSKKHDTVRLLEYKTGSKMNTESAIRQLAFYAVLWELSGNPGTVTELRLINPRLQAVYTAELTEDLKKAALLRVAKLRTAIDKNDFPYKCSDGKFAACHMCTLEELPRLFPDDGFERFSDIYDT